MAEDPSPSPTALSDYDVIEQAVTETERGRWFLKEFSRRNRVADTRTLLDAIARLEAALLRDQGAPDLEPVRTGLAAMAELIAETKARIAAVPFGSLERAGLDPLSVVARTSRRVASTLAATADHLRDAASSLRDHGVGPDLCRAVDRQAIEVSTTATIQDLAAQRVAAIVETLYGLDARIDALMMLCEGPDPAREDGEGRFERPPPRAAPAGLGRLEVDADLLRFPLHGAPGLAP